MDPVDRFSIGEANVRPESGESEIDEGEEEVETRELGEAGGEEVLDAALPVEVVELGADVH